MKRVSASKAKATFLAVLRQVERTRRPVGITKFGKQVAILMPAGPEEPNTDWIGSMDGTVTFMGDIVSPAADEQEWEALKD
jgi:prevent-host-death family protein